MLAQGKNQAVDGAHQRVADGRSEAEPVDGMRGQVVAVVSAVVGEGDQPHEDVDDGVDEHEAELSADAHLRASALALDVGGSVGSL